MSCVITVENLDKKYYLKHQSQRGSYLALRDVLTDGMKSLGGRLLGRGLPAQETQREEFWALRGVSFEVHQGDRLAVVGRNGAGKSTLLKILSRITEPSAGSVRIRGRVASLLEVGTGFHPELTGRENIFLNGAVLGMSRREIKRCFDEIVDFAEVERFLDTPVKRYSSGMYVRLAFAVAAHLEPEILIVDEVLAVGDAQFQKKCIGKMEDVSTKGGRTIIFVSHNLPALRALCNRCIWIESGRVKDAGELHEVTDKYALSGLDLSPELTTRKGSRFLRVYLVDASDSEKAVFSQDDEGFLSIELYVERSRDLNCGITLYNAAEVPLFSSCVLDSFAAIEPGTTRYKLRVPLELLPSGTYRIEGALWNDVQQFDQRECLAVFSVVRNDAILEMRRIGSRAPLRFPYRWDLWKFNG